MKARDLLSHGYLFAGMALFGSATPVSKLVTGAFPVFIGSALRALTATLALLPIVLLWPRERRSIRPGVRKRWVSLTFIVLIGMVGFTIAMMYGMRLVSGVVGSIVMSTTPAVTGVAAILFLRERPDWRVLVAVGLAVAGVLVMNFGSVEVTAEWWIGALLVFAAVCCEAAYTLLGKPATREMSSLTVAALVAGASVPLFAIGAGFEISEFATSGLTWRDWLAVAWWGAGTMGLGTVLWYAGVKRTRGSTAAAYMGVMPVSALVLSILIKTFLVQAFFIPSGSMENPFLTGDRVLVSKLTPGPFDLSRGDVVVFVDPGGWLEQPADRRNAFQRGVEEVLTFVGLLPQNAGEHLIKRIIGMGGDTVECCDDGGRVMVKPPANQRHVDMMFIGDQLHDDFAGLYCLEDGQQGTGITMMKPSHRVVQVCDDNRLPGVSVDNFYCVSHLFV